MQQRKGFGIIEGLVVVAIVIVIAGLIYVALAPKKSPQESASSSSPQTTPANIDQVQADKKALDQEDGADVQKELNSLTTDLDSL